TSGFIAGQGYRRQATCRSPARPGPGHDGFRPIALTEGAAYRDGLGSILAGATLRVRLGPLAQLVEQGTLNPKVAGSIPARPTFSDVAQPALSGWIAARLLTLSSAIRWRRSAFAFAVRAATTFSKSNGDGALWLAGRPGFPVRRALR